MSTSERLTITLGAKPKGWEPKPGELCVGFIRMLEPDPYIPQRLTDVRYKKPSVGTFEGWTEGGEALLKNAASSTGYQYVHRDELRPFVVECVEDGS